MFRRYKEIFYGLGLGLAMWVVDAAMHAQLGAEVQSHGLAAELLRPGATQLFFRVVFVAISTALGWALWRSNWRERELRALEDAVVAFHRQLDGSAVRIMSYARMLQSRPGLEHDEVARAVVADLGDDARAIDELTRQYVRFSEHVMAGRTREAVETLVAIREWAGGRRHAAVTEPPAGATRQAG